MTVPGAPAQELETLTSAGGILMMLDYAALKVSETPFCSSKIESDGDAAILPTVTSNLYQNSVLISNLHLSLVLFHLHSYSKPFNAAVQ